MLTVVWFRSGSPVVSFQEKKIVERPREFKAKEHLEGHQYRRRCLFWKYPRLYSRIVEERSSNDEAEKKQCTTVENSDLEEDCCSIIKTHSKRISEADSNKVVSLPRLYTKEILKKITSIFKWVNPV
jgi:hypothetical protein